MIKAIAIDEEITALQQIEILSKKTSLLQLDKTFSKPADALKYINKFPVDIIFIDVTNSSVKQVELYKNLRQDTMVILTSTDKDCAPASFNLDPIDCLVKPFTFERFLQAVNKANTYFNYQLQHPRENEEGFIYIRADYKLLKINTNDIILIEGLDDYLKIHLVNQKPVVARMTLKAITEKLPAEKFMRVHKSYVVSIGMIKTIKGRILAVGEEEIPVSSSYEKIFFERFPKAIYQQKELMWQ